MLLIKNSYNVIGVMSGTSLDGIDLCFSKFSKHSSDWRFSIYSCETINYNKYWKLNLSKAHKLSKTEIQKLDNEYTLYLASVIKKFIYRNKLNNIDFISSHGHTIFHQPTEKYTFQLGNNVELRNLTKLPVICDFRSQDVNLGGQGAPLVPVGDLLLFNNFSYCINLGGFSNISIKRNSDIIAYDICPVNVVLNHYCRKIGFEYDHDGNLAKSGFINNKLLIKLNTIDFYTKIYPKSLSIEWVESNIYPIIDSIDIDIKDVLRTFVEHIAFQISKIISDKNANILITGGGVKNDFLFSLIKEKIPNTIIKPTNKLIDFKEALIFGFLGVLRVRNEINCLKSVTGALKDHCSGEIFE